MLSFLYLDFFCWVFFTRFSLLGLLCRVFFLCCLVFFAWFFYSSLLLCAHIFQLFDLKAEGRAPKASLIFRSIPFGHCNRNPLLLVELVKSSRGHKKATIMRSCRHPKRHFDSVADNQFQTPLQGRRNRGARESPHLQHYYKYLFLKKYCTKCKELKDSKNYWLNKINERSKAARKYKKYCQIYQI